MLKHAYIRKRYEPPVSLTDRAITFWIFSLLVQWLDHYCEMMGVMFPGPFRPCPVSYRAVT